MNGASRRDDGDGRTATGIDRLHARGLPAHGGTLTVRARRARTGDWDFVLVAPATLNAPRMNGWIRQKYV